MKKTIQKVLSELKAEKPDLSYIRGLLEGLVDEEVFVSAVSPSVNIPALRVAPTNTLDEGGVLDGVAKANLNNIKRLAEESSQ